MKILVVDDEQDICEILQYNLETEGFEVVTANSAEEALQLPLHEFSLILLDVMMGEMSGFQMARRLKDSPATAQIPIIFITALDGEDNLVKGLNIGADDYIAKPLSMKEVKARVRAVLRRTLNMEHGTLNMEHGHVIQDNRICYESITLDLNAKTVTLDGECAVLVGHILSLFWQSLDGCSIVLFSEGHFVKNRDGIREFALRCRNHDIVFLKGDSLYRRQGNIIFRIAMCNSEEIVIVGHHACAGHEQHRCNKGFSLHIVILNFELRHFELC
jgi:DNA-binding response OmpR family regulator